MLEYVRASTVEEALNAVKLAKGPVLYFAGGTDILVKAREKECYYDRSVIDIYEVKALKGVTDCGDTLRIGALTTHAEIAESSLIQRYATILSLASATVGSPQIRNHATIGGNIANASPAADTFSALAVLHALVEVRRTGETMTLSLCDVVLGPYKTSLQNGDLITAVIIRKLPEGCQSNFYKLGRRRALAISRMTVSTVLQMNKDGKVMYFDMTLGATFPQPLRFDDISAMLIGKKNDEMDIAAVAKAISNKIPEIAGIRHSTQYKQPVAEKLAVRILKKMILGENDE
ncbi:MAG: FAD binding domain-containing protein [Clostridia bacterium]